MIFRDFRLWFVVGCLRLVLCQTLYNEPGSLRNSTHTANHKLQTTNNKLTYLTDTLTRYGFKKV